MMLLWDHRFSKTISSVLFGYSCDVEKVSLPKSNGMKIKLFEIIINNMMLP